MLRIVRRVIPTMSAVLFIICGYWGYGTYKQKEFRDNIISNIKGIVCWGDSLTYGVGGGNITYPATLYTLISKNLGDIPVYNLGVGGESSKQIMARNGALGIKILTDLTIPAEKMAIKINLQLTDGTNAAILRQGKRGIETVSINGIPGQLSIEQESVTSENYAYYFTRETAGREVRVTEGTLIQIDSSLKYKNYIPIIFIGTNGGWSTPDELIEQIESMVTGQ